MFRLVAPCVGAMWLTIANLNSVSVITADPFRLAMLLVVLECSTGVFELPTGLIADSFSRKWSMVIGYVIWGGGFLLQALLPIYEVTLLLSAYAGGTILGILVFVWSPSFAVAALAYYVSQVLRAATKPIFMIRINRRLPSASAAHGVQSCPGW